MPKLAVLILTQNEEKNIAECMASADFADEIVVIDSGSQDRTGQLVEELGGKFVLHPMDEEGFAGQRNFALTQTTAEWVLYLDADERIQQGLVPKIQQIVAENQPQAYELERKNLVFGKLMRYGGHRSDYSGRLYPREAIHWQGKVHEQVITSLNWTKLEQGLYHYTYDTWEQYIQKLNRYTTMAAQEMVERQTKVTGWGAIGHAVGGFLRDYFVRRGFMDGFYGLVMAGMAGTYTLIKYLKVVNLYRLQKKAGQQ